jgi:RimJ/RimL family protein N-acetyltransferase
VRLRSVEMEDAERYFPWINDPDVTEHLQLRYPISRASQRAWTESASTSYELARFAVEVIEDGAHIGTVDLRPSRPESRCAELGIMIGDKTRWGGGYGTDTMRTVCRFGFEEMNLHRIELDVYEENERAVKVYERVGFKHSGRRREAVYQRGHYQDVILMDLLEGELVSD